MSELYGSSRIPQIASSTQEDIFRGPTGPAGGTGPDGQYLTGPTGFGGRYILFAEGVSADTMRIELQEDGTFIGSEIYVSGIRGITGNEEVGTYSVGYTGATNGAVYIVQGPSGLTLFFKGIEFQGKITGSYANNNLHIYPSEIPYTGDLTPNRLLYIGYTSANEYYIVIPVSTSVYDERFYAGKTYSSLETLFYAFKETGTGSNFNYSTNPARNDSNLTIDINASFYGLTFSGASVDFSNSTSYLKYGINYGTILDVSNFETNLITFKTKSNFTKKIGEDVFTPLNEKIGSCCYCDVLGKRFCKDYVLRNYCLGAFAGSWSSIPCYLRYTTDDCYPGGACCVNGKCLLSTEEKCSIMGGLYVPGENCSSIECPDACVTTGCCCVKGTGLTLTEELCAEISNSRWFEDSCEQVNCCQVGYLGACCIRKNCYDYFSATECAATGGIFQGVGSACISQFLNCCTDPTNN